MKIFRVVGLGLISACGAVLAGCGSPSDAYGVNGKTCQGEDCPYYDYGRKPDYPYTWSSADVLRRECNQAYYYDFDSDKTVEAVHQQPIQAIAQYLVENPAAMITLVGNTDRCGTPAYNRGLGLRRAHRLAKEIRQEAANYAEAHHGLATLGEFDREVNGNQRVKVIGAGMDQPAKNCGDDSNKLCTLQALGLEERACAPAKSMDSRRAMDPDKKNRRVELFIHDPKNKCNSGVSEK